MRPTDDPDLVASSKRTLMCLGFSTGVTRLSAGEEYSNRYNNALRTAANRTVRLWTSQASELRYQHSAEPRRTSRKVSRGLGFWAGGRPDAAAFRPASEWCHDGGLTLAFRVVREGPQVVPQPFELGR